MEVYFCTCIVLLCMNLSNSAKFLDLCDLSENTEENNDNLQENYIIWIYISALLLFCLNHNPFSATEQLFSITVMLFFCNSLSDRKYTKKLTTFMGFPRCSRFFCHYFLNIMGYILMKNLHCKISLLHTHAFSS